MASFFSGYSQTAQDHLGIPGPVVYDQLIYNLAWSALPTKIYFKQEYLPSGSDTVHFDRMILIEAVEGDYKLEDVVDLKVTELKEMQKKNPVVNFAVFNNPDKTEYIVDFILSRGKKRLNLIEWNAYKYKLFVDSSGRKGVQLFGVCFRDTNDITAFFNALPDLRKKELKKLISYPMPNIQPGN